MLKKFTPILLFIIGLLISLLLGLAAWDSGYLQSAEDKKIEEQLVAEKKAAEEKAAADKLAAEIAASDKAAAEKAAAAQKLVDERAAAEQKLAEEKAAAEKAAADKLAAEIAASQKAAAEKAAAEQKLAEEKAAAEKTAAEQKLAEEKAAAEQKLAEEKAAAEKTAAEQKLAEEKAAAEKAAAEQKLAEEKAAAEKAAAEQKLAEEKAAAEKAAAEKAAAEQKLAEEKAAAEKAAAEAEAAAALNIDAIQTAMKFDILTIEPNGNAVIAGLALANSKVEIVDALNQNSVIATEPARGSGEFAIVLDKPLSEGKHELYIQARDKNENKFVSNEIALIEVFSESLNKTPVVILSKTGVATRILQGEEAKAASEETASQNEQSEAETTEEVASLSQESNEAADAQQAEEKPAPINAVFIKAADVEGGNLIIAGVGPADGVLNIYVNDELLGQTKITENNSFIMEQSYALEAGRHSIRADRIDAVTNKVLGRAEVSLIHEPEVAEAEEKVEEETTTPTATQEPATTEEAATTEAATPESATTEVAAASEENATQEASTTEDTAQEAQTTEQASAEGENTQEAKEEIRTGTTVIIRRGDSLWRVSRKNYGEGVKFTTIFDANKDQIKDPNLIYPGQVLSIPDAE